MTTSGADDGLRFAGGVGDLHEAIRRHYDDLIEIYEDLWGEHIHHGYWDLDERAADRHTAQVRTVEELVAFGEVPPGGRVLDAGCGIGSSGFYLARELGCRVDGITLSLEQVRRGEDKARQAGLDQDQVRFHHGDVLASPFDPGTFDVVWSLESCELMPDKATFLGECHRLLKPGGRLVVATWCSRDANPSPEEVRLLRRIYKDFSVAYVLPLDRYAALCHDAGFEDVRTADWTEHTRPTWKLSVELVKPFVRHAATVWRLVREKGADTFRFLNSVPLMKKAYETGLMRYGVFRGTRPDRP